MVTVLKTEGGTQIISANLQKTIQSIKEIVGNHSDSEIYNTLKETHMDPNETAQKLLNQDTFHEVRRRRDKKKENAVYNGYVESRKRAEYVGKGTKFNGHDHSARRGGYTRSADAGTSREFRVVRDNRVNQNSDRETTSFHVSPSANVQQSNDSVKSASSVSNSQRHLVGRYVHNLNGGTDFRPKVTRDIHSSTRKEHLDEKNLVGSGSTSQVSMVESSNFQSQPGGHPTSNPVGIYASASDPVHVPSPDSRSPAAIGALRRDVGVVGGQRSSVESTSKQSFQQSIANLNSILGNSSATESFRPLNSGSQDDQSHASVVESSVISSAAGRLGSHFGGRMHQQAVGHQKGGLPIKEWKPKAIRRSSVSSPGIIGSPVKAASKAIDNSKNVDSEVEQLESKISQVNIHEGENVIIAEHIRVPENDRCRVTFGSFVEESDGAENEPSTVQAPERVEDETCEPSPSNKLINSDDDQVRNSASSTSSGAASEKRESSLPSAENYAGMTLVHESPSFSDSNTQQLQDPIELPNSSSVYDPQPIYDMPIFRPPIDETVRGSGFPSHQEALLSHAGNSIPASSITMMQQQAPMAQMYPQVHVSHFANVMPYRQYIPPLYVPSMVSGNPGYSHLSNGSSYVLMPGGGSHVAATNLKYGVQQFKPLPAGSPTGFANFANPAGFTVNGTGLDESSRLKYKDNSLYVPNPQAETSEVWIQNHREHPGMQSTPYFNVQGQSTHPAYLQSPNGHASFNAAQSSHVQYPGMYPPPPAAIPNAHHHHHHHLGGTGNIGMAPATPGTQVGLYPQPQMGHLNWPTNF